MGGFLGRHGVEQMSASIVNLKLVRQAWPKGFLAIRGVLTVGGWTCLGPSPNHLHGGNSLWLAPDMVSIYVQSPDSFVWCYGGDPFDHAPFLRALEAGDLLPRVDTEDPATWGACLASLGRALGFSDEDRSLTWSQGSRGEAGWSYGLASASRKITSRNDRYATHTKEYWSCAVPQGTPPARALVLAMIEAQWASEEDAG